MVGQTTRPNVPRRIRHRFGPWIDRLAELVGRPVDHVYPAGYAGTVRLPRDDLETKLRDGGFTWDPVSLYHYTPSGERADGSWVYRPSPLADRQIHAVLFVQGPERVDVYAHEEYNWLRHPLGHAAQENIHRDRGSATMRAWLDARDVPYDRRGRVRRGVDHLVQRLRKEDDRAPGSTGLSRSDL